jgi:Uma2 family endonuclease
MPCYNTAGGIEAATLMAPAEAVRVIGMKQEPLTLRRWERVEYERLVDLGAFEGDAVELVGGHLIVAEPHGTYHASSISAVDYAVRAALPPGWIVRVQLPMSLGDDSVPEPDLAVVQGRPADYREAHPAGAALVVEVAESSLHFDRRDKGGLYARSAILDYWIVNVADRVVEVYRDPVPDGTAVYGWRYRSVTTLRAPDVAIPLAFSSSAIAVADLLP